MRCPGTFSFVHAADLHLGGRRWLRSQAPNAELGQLARAADRYALENLIELCLEQRARLLLLAGDIMDGWCRDYQVALRLARELERLADSGTECFLLLGNHDVRNRALGSLLLPQHVHVLGRRAPETLVLEDVNVAVHGWSAPEVEEGDDVVRHYPEPVPGAFNLGVLHTSAEGVLGHADYAPCSRRALRQKGYDYWALGHVHERAVLSESPYVVFPGNLQARGAREVGPKGATLVRVTAGRVTACEHRPLDVLRFATEVVEVEGACDLAALDRIVARQLNGRREEGPAQVMRLVLEGADAASILLGLSGGERAEWLEGWTQRLGERGIWLDECWVEYPNGAGGFELGMAA